MAVTKHNYQLEKCYFHKSWGVTLVNSTVTLVKNTNNHPAYFIAIVEVTASRKDTHIGRLKEKCFIDQTINIPLAGIPIYNIHQAKMSLSITFTMMLLVIQLRI